MYQRFSGDEEKGSGSGGIQKGKQRVMGMIFTSKSFDFRLLLFYIPLLLLEFTIGIIFVQPFHTRKKRP